MTFFSPDSIRNGSDQITLPSGKIAISDKDGFTDWIPVIPTITSNEPYVAKAIFPDGRVIWSEPFLIESGEKKVIQIIQGTGNK